MSRRREPDKLARDAMECKRLGYGCRYGYYIAARDAETPDYLRRLAEAPKAVLPPPEKDADGPVVIVQEGGKKVRYCQVCGLPLGRLERRYCKEPCARLALNKRKAEYDKKRRGKA